MDTVNAMEEGKSENKADSGDLMALENDKGNRMSDPDLEVNHLDVTTNEGFKDKTSCEMTKGNRLSDSDQDVNHLDVTSNECLKGKTTYEMNDFNRMSDIDQKANNLVATKYEGFKDETICKISEDNLLSDSDQDATISALTSQEGCHDKTICEITEGNRLSDSDQKVNNSAVRINGGLPDETSGLMTEVSAGGKIKRYDRDFLLQFQYDSLVSKEPISLPVISGIECHNRKHKKELYRSKIPRHKTDNYSEKYCRQTMYRNEHKSNHFNDRSTCSLDETSKSNGNNDLTSMETLQYDDTCFVVIDCEGIDDETSKHAKNKDHNTEHKTLKPNDEILVEEELTIENENISEVSLKRKGHDEHNGTRGKEKRMKTYHSIRDQRDNADYKHRRSHWGERSKRQKFHKRTGNKDKSFGPRERSIRRRSRQRSFNNWHSENTEYSRGKYNGQEADRNRSNNGDNINIQHENSYRQDIDHFDTQLRQFRPILFENGIKIQPEFEQETCAIQEHMENPLSPVSDRSISPYADFTRFRQNSSNEEKVSPEKLNREVSNPHNIVRNGICVEETGFQNANNVQMGGHQPHTFINRNYIANRTNGYENGFQSLQPPFFGMGFQPQPYLQSQMASQGNQMSNGSFQNGNCVPACFTNRFLNCLPTRYQPFQNNVYPEGTVQHCQNNITVKERVPVLTKEEIEHIWVSTSTNKSLPIDVQYKIRTVIYRAMIKAEKPQFSPEDVIKIMKQNRPVQVEFETKAALIDLLNHNEDRFSMWNDGRVIFPKTNIKLCSSFTNNPRYGHDCMDLHICKYFLLGNCQTPNCKFSHKLTLEHNAKVLESYGLGGLNEKLVKHLIRNLDSRNITTTPLICKFYNNVGGCRKGENCMHLHLCLHFIINDCEFEQCRRSHDIYDQHTRTVLERHGIFPTDSTHDRIITLLKSTLKGGKVKLKRELSNQPKVNADASSDRPLANKFPRLSNTNEVAANKAANIHVANGDTESAKSMGSRNKDKEESRQKGLFSDPDKNLGQLHDWMTYSIHHEHELKSLPEFIPLETTRDTNEDIVKIVNKTKATTDVESLPQTEVHNVQESNDEKEKILGDKVKEQDVVNILLKEKSEFESKNLSSENARLPILRPLRYEMEENGSDITENVKDITESIQDVTEKVQDFNKSTQDIDESVRNSTETVLDTTENVNNVNERVEDISEKIQVVTERIQDKNLDRTFDGRLDHEADGNEDGVGDEKCMAEEYETNTTSERKNVHSSTKTEPVENGNLSQLDNGYIDHSTNSKDVTNCLPMYASEYKIVADDGNRSNLKPEIIIKVINECGRYRLRKTDDKWQLQRPATGRTGSEVPDVYEEASWIDTSVAESDSLENIYHAFNEFIRRNISATPDIKKSDE